MADKYSREEAFNPGPLRFLLDSMYQMRSRRPTQPAVGVPFTDSYRYLSDLLPEDFRDDGEDTTSIPITGGDEAIGAIKRRQRMLDEI